MNTRAQAFDDDAALWLNISLEKEISKKLDLQLTSQNRIGNNMSLYQQGGFDLGLVYKLSKNVRLCGDYVLRESRRLDGSYSTRNRFYGAIILRKKLGRVTFIYRNRVQMQLKDIYTSPEGNTPVIYERNKLTVRYNLNKHIEAYAGGELYLPFYNLSQIGFDKYRTTIGTEYKLSKKVTLKVISCFSANCTRLDS